MSLQNIVVAGGGVLGSQIAFQSAFCGKDVTIWLRSESSKTRTQPKLDSLKQSYLDAIDQMAAGESWYSGICPDPAAFNKDDAIARVNAAHQSIKLVVPMAEAFANADLIIESMAENADEKSAFYQKLAPHLPEQTLLVTNSSTLLPSQFAQVTGRPAKFCALHFANNIHQKNTAEVMAHPGTDEAVFQQIIDFAGQINMIALPIRKEKNGYLLNSLLVPFLLSGLDLYVNGISDPASIDLAWTQGTGAPRGPFAIFDHVGITTALNIVDQYQKVPTLILPKLLNKMMMPYNFKGMKEVLQKMVDEGKLGVSTGEGFYKYN